MGLLVKSNLINGTEMEREESNQYESTFYHVCVLETTDGVKKLWLRHTSGMTKVPIIAKQVHFIIW